MNLKAIYYLPVLLLMPFMLLGQEKFEGRIILGVSVEGPYAEQMKSMMPSANEYLIKGKMMKLSIEGGMMPSMLGENNGKVEMIINGSQSETYLLQHSAKTVFKMQQSEEDASELTPKVTPSSETAEIAGYKCKKYDVTLTTPDGSFTQQIWATDQINVEKPEGNAMGGQSQILFKEIDGFPLKVVSDLPMGAGTMTMMAQEVVKENVSDSEFEVPSDYTEKEFDAAMMMGLGN